MKIQEILKNPAEPKALWEILMNGTGYGEWNPYLQSAGGEFAMDGELEIKLALPGAGLKTIKAKVTGWVEGRYFSFVDVAPVGAWWFSREHIFRLREDDGPTLFAEIYCYGLRLRWGSHGIKLAHQRGLSSLLTALENKGKSSS